MPQQRHGHTAATAPTRTDHQTHGKTTLHSDQAHVHAMVLPTAHAATLPIHSMILTAQQ